METARIDWYRSPIDKALLQKLTRKSDIKGLLQAGSFLLIFAATTAAAVYFFSKRLWVPMILVCYVHAIFHNFLSMAAAVHELSHGTVFKTKALNEFFYYLYSFLTWNNPVHFRASHMFHHQLTVFRGRDKEVIQGPVKDRMNWKNYILWFTFDVTAFAKFFRLNLLHALGNGDPDYFFWTPLFPKDDPRRRAMCAFARVVIVGHLLLLAIFIYFQLWVLIFLVTFGSFFASFLAKFCGAMQHSGLSASTPDWRAVCHTVTFDPITSYLYWYMNYHTEHHMYAAVPCYNLRKLHKALKDDMAVPQKSYLAGLRLLLRIKKKQEEDPSFIYVPELPPTAAPIKWS